MVPSNKRTDALHPALKMLGSAGAVEAIQEGLERARRMELLNEAALSLHAIEDSDSLLDWILAIAEEALGFRSVALLLADPGRETLVVDHALNRPGIKGLRLPVGQGVVGSVFLSGEPELVADVATDPRYVDGGGTGGHSEMAAPLTIGGEIIGVLDAESEQESAFSASDLEIFTLFAAHTAAVIHRVRDRARVERQSRIDRQIMKATHALNATRDVESLLHVILKAAQEALGLESVALLIPERGTQELVLRTAVGYGPVLGTRIAFGEGVSGKVAATGRPALVKDVARSGKYVAGVAGGVTEMCVPLQVYGELLGVLDTESARPDAFQEEDLAFFALFAEQAAMAIHNAQLFQHLEVYSGQIQEANLNLEGQLRQLNLLFEASRTLSSSLDLGATLDSILRMTSGIVNSSAATIKLLDQETMELKVKAQAGFTHDQSESWDQVDFPLRIGERTIGVFELIRDAGEIMADDDRQMLETLATHAAIAIENATLFEDTQQSYYDTLKTLARAMEARDDYTRGHSERVAELSLTLAQALATPEELTKSIFNAALLHDIGKMGVRDSVLLSAMPLSPEELEHIRRHPANGNKILGPLKFLGKVAEFVKYHHERWDGKGYPTGIRGEDIPLASRIISVADTYDAMTSSRPYRTASSHEAAMAEIQRQRGTQFDPRIVDAFVKLMAVGRS